MKINASLRAGMPLHGGAENRNGWLIVLQKRIDDHADIPD
jgi:hypothetical protein